MKENLQAFLYLLMRDKLSVGAVVEVVNESTAAANAGKEITYTAEPMAEYAGQLADRILNAGTLDSQDAEDADLLARVMAHVKEWIDPEKVRIIPMKTPIDQQTEFEPGGAPYCVETRNLVTDDDERVSKCAAAIATEIKEDVGELKDGQILVYRPFKLILPYKMTGRSGGQIMFRYAKRVVKIDR